MGDRPIHLGNPVTPVLTGPDPGAVGAGLLWLDETVSPAVLRQRAGNNLSWTAVLLGAPAIPVLKHIVFPFAFDTPGLVPQHFAITAVNQGAKTLTFAGDHRALFPDASTVVVQGSTANDGSYTQNGAAALVGGDTVITTHEALPSAVADGTLVDITTAGVVVPGWTPAVDDIILIEYISYAANWDGTFPTYDTYIGTAIDAQAGTFASFATTASLSDSNPDLAVVNAHGATPQNNAIPGVSFGFITGYVHVLSGGALRVVVSQDGTPSGADPGSTHGAAVLHLLVLPA